MQPIVETASGKVRGSQVDGVSEFLGIPYAAPPVGPALFQEAAPAARWDGVRDVVEFGPTPPKPGYLPPFDQLLTDPVIPGEEFLNLNVWTPDPGGAGLPVLVWIYGGAFRNGCTAVPTYNGRAFARDGVVLVSLNYRLGAAGFGLFPDAPANLGLRDQLAGLEWVRENIAGFGGDPDNVTVFGESAGAMSVSTLLSLDRGLFSKAIAQSGGAHTVVTAEDARLVTAELGRRLGVEPTAAALGEVDVSALIAAQQSISLDAVQDPNPERWGASIVAVAMAFAPVLDGELITQRPIDAIAAGAAANVPLLTGTTTEEYRFFIVPPGLDKAITPEALAGSAARHGWHPRTVETYTANRPDASPGDVLAAIITDSYFRLPAIRLAEARADGPADTYCYEFGWRSPVLGLGACHALEIGFVFDTLTRPGGQLMTGAHKPQALADQMHAAWVSFARDGDPGWPAYQPSNRAVMTFDSPNSELVVDPRADERQLWDGRI